MRTDFYTKAMLTVIAACLVYLCLGTPAVFSTAQAQTGPTKVIIAGWTERDRNVDRDRDLSNFPLPVKESAHPFGN